MEKQYVCQNCGFIGKPKRFTKGSFFIEIVLWLFLMVPGLIYTIWRLTTKVDMCPSCKNIGMIPADSPVGRKLIAATTPDRKVAVEK